MQADLLELRCPACGHTMEFAGSIRQPEGLAELQSFGCEGCGLTISGEAAAEVLQLAA
jgi:hypothetical protein